MARVAALLILTFGLSSCETGGTPSQPTDGSTQAGDAADATSQDGGDGGAADAPEGSPGCSDDVGPPLDCPDGGSDAGCGLADDECRQFAAHLKPRVAHAMFDCVAGSGCQSSDFTNCMNAALGGACADPSAAASCKPIVAVCSGVNETACESELAGMTASGRAAVVACATKDGGSCLVLQCIQSVL